MDREVSSDMASHGRHLNENSTADVGTIRNNVNYTVLYHNHVLIFFLSNRL